MRLLHFARAVTAASFLLFSSFARAQSRLGFPGHRFDAFDDHFGFGGMGLGRQHDFYHPHDYYRPACPPYQPMQLSQWQFSSHSHKLQAILPSVKASDRRAKLSSDGMHLEILGVRPVPTRGHVHDSSCLPEDALISRDGQYEILEASVPLPQGADVGRATVRQYGAHGLEVTVPSNALHRTALQQQRSKKPPGAMTARRWHAGQSTESISVRPQPSKHSTQIRPEIPPIPPKPKTKTETLQRPAVPPLPAHPVVVLPSSDGVQVLDEDYAYPEKNSDASSGWMDNRGEFQEY